MKIAPPITAPDGETPPASPSGPPPAAGRSRRWSWLRIALNAALALFVAYLVLVPLAILVYSSFKDSGTNLPFEVPGFSIQNYVSVFLSSRLASVALNTLIYTVGSLLVSLVVSVALAYLFERTDIPGRKVLTPLALAPLAIPVTVMAIAWALVANPANGPLALLLKHLFGVHADIYTMPGMILVMGLFGVPSMYLMIAPALAAIGPEFEEAAAALGTPLRRRLRLIVMPLIGPAVSAASIMAVVVILEGFAIPALLGLPKQIFVFASLIQYYLQPPSGVANYGDASTYGVIILVITMVMTLVYRRQTRHASRFRVVTGKAYRHTRSSLGAWRVPAACIVWLYMIVSVVLPILALLWTSLSPNNRPITLSGLRTLTFTNFTQVVTAQGMGQVLGNTVEVVLVTATVTTLLSLWMAASASRRSFRGSGLLMESTSLALGMPSIVLGSAVLFVYLFLPIPIFGTNWIIIIALVTRFIPRGSRLIQAALLQLDDGLFEAARVTGASPSAVTRTVLLPLLRPALLKTWLWIFAHALGELPIALLLTSTSNKTLVVQLWDTFTTSADYPQACALAVVILVVSSAAVLIVNRSGAQGEA